MRNSLVFFPVTEYVSKRYNFTNRESEIYTLLILNGFSNQEIADALSISVRTVRNHIQRMMEKTGADSSRKLMALGFRSVFHETR
jgi:DNA-binding NarL/FixJ family response regulator